MNQSSKYAFLVYFGNDTGVYKTMPVLDLPNPPTSAIVQVARGQLPDEWLINSDVLQIV